MFTKVLTFLVVLLVVVVAVIAAPSAESTSAGAGGALLETAPATAMRVRAAPALAPRAGCTDSGCYALCVAMGWVGGFCLDADWCLCYR